MRWMLLVVLLVGALARADVLPGFDAPGEFSEQIRHDTSEDGVKIYCNAAGSFDAGKKTELIIYLLPNGNTIEQTLGRRMTPGLDWHFDIQHIAAQVRVLRQLDSTENVVLCCLEAPGKTWPSFRAAHADNPQRIGKLVGRVEGFIPPAPGMKVRTALVAHSGGGSFLIGYLNGGAIGDDIDRIVFLDANYSYSDDLHHGDILLDWLQKSAEHRLVVFAYDDRNVKLNGKPIVSETGGTWRASQRMMQRFTIEQKGEQGKAGPFEHFSFLGGQAQFFLHPNPEVKILHTAMIGEMNAFLQAMTIGTDEEGKWGTLGGPRAYTQWIGDGVEGEKAAEISLILKLPRRPATAPNGSEFFKMIEKLPTEQREKLVIEQVLAGNVPGFLRNLKAINVSAKGPDRTNHVGTYFVTPDVLAVGSDRDFFRMPLTPVSAQRLADAMGCSLITRKMSDDIYQQAQVKLVPMPLTEKRDSTEAFYESNQMIEAQRVGQPLGLLVAGIKKDVVLTNKLAGREGYVAIYGWHKLDGIRIQPLYVGHLEWYVDYSHGIRLVAAEMMVDGRPMAVKSVLGDAALCGLISDEGVIGVVRYSDTTQPAKRPASNPVTRPATGPSNKGF